ncbi:MAG TPA: alpha/beta hydrolase [Bryobacteraceae bacterium]|nr:alpha/beta hydrolase [Bryobacteraceae bacterium]
MIRLLAYPIIAYLTGGVMFWLKQDRLLFPGPEVAEQSTPAELGLHFEDLRIPVNAHDALHAWWIPASASTEKVILAFHGNAETLETMVSYAIPELRELGTNLLLIDYRGYGSSSPVTPNEKSVLEDASAAFRYLLQARKTPPAAIFLLGRSIGSGPATYLASSNPGVGGLILESPFSSIDDAASGFWYFRMYPSRLILRTHFDNLTRIRSAEAPVLIIAGTADTLTPSWMAERLFAQARQPKQLYLVPNAGHNDLLTVGGRALTAALQRMVR